MVPIIENTAHEHELADSMADAMLAYPDSFAVLVRRHGVYVWGRDWIEAKRHAECYDYVFEAAVKMHQLGFDASVAPGDRSSSGGGPDTLGPDTIAPSALAPSALAPSALAPSDIAPSDTLATATAPTGAAAADMTASATAARDTAALSPDAAQSAAE